MKNKKYVELGSAKVEGERHIIISENQQTGDFVIKQALINGFYRGFLPGVIVIPGVDGLENLRDALNIALDEVGWETDDLGKLEDEVISKSVSIAYDEDNIKGQMNIRDLDKNEKIEQKDLTEKKEDDIINTESKKKFDWTPIEIKTTNPLYEKCVSNGIECDSDKDDDYYLKLLLENINKENKVEPDKIEEDDVWNNYSNMKEEV